MTRLPVSQFPAWSREIERKRVTETLLTTVDVSRAAGKFNSWWCQVCLNERPPIGWKKIERKILILLDRHSRQA